MTSPLPYSVSSSSRSSASPHAKRTRQQSDPLKSCSSSHLDPDFFRNVRITYAQKQHYSELANRTLHDGIKSFEQFAKNDFTHSEQYKFIKRKQDVDIFRNRMENTKGRAELTAYGTLDGSVDDLVYAEYSPTDAQVRHKCSFVDSYAVKDVRVVRNILTKDDSYDATAGTFKYVGIKWMLTRLPVPGIHWIVKSRDWLFLEAVGIVQVNDFYNVHGPIRIGYHIIQPCMLQEVPPFEKFTRSKMRCTTLFYQRSNQKLQFFSRGFVDYSAESVNDTLATFASMGLVTRVFSMVQFAECQKLQFFRQEVASGSLAHMTNQNEKNHVDQCALCCRRMNAMRRLTTHLKPCKICNILVCHKCRVYKTIYTDQGPEKARFCQQCLLSSKILAVSIGSSTTSTNHTESKLPQPDVSNSDSAQEDASSGSSSFVSSNQESQFPHMESNTPQSILYPHSPDTRQAQSLNTCLEASISLDSKSHHSNSILQDNESNSEPPSPHLAHRARLFQQMIALQRAAETAYNITQANRTFIKS